MNLVEAAEQVVKDHQAAYLVPHRASADSWVTDYTVEDHGGRGAVLLDATTANALLTVYRGLNETNQQRFLSLPLQRAVSIAWKLIA